MVVMNATRNVKARWEILLLHSIGNGHYHRKGFGRRTDAMAAAAAMTVPAGYVAVVEAACDVKGPSRFALIRGQWVTEPSREDVIAATSRIDPGYARQLWTNLASSATSAGRTWTCAYVNSSDQVVSWPWSDRVAA